MCVCGGHSAQRRRGRRGTSSWRRVLLEIIACGSRAAVCETLIHPAHHGRSRLDGWHCAAQAQQGTRKHMSHKHRHTETRTHALQVRTHTLTHARKHVYTTRAHEHTPHERTHAHVSTDTCAHLPRAHTHTHTHGCDTGTQARRGRRRTCLRRLRHMAFYIDV